MNKDNDQLKLVDPVEDKGVKLAQEVYLWMLENIREPLPQRLKAQDILCSLRDFISEKTGVYAQEVQDSYEEKALLRRLGKK